MRKWDNNGTDKILSVYWFAILFIVAGGIIYMAVLFYGQPYDVREVEANSLINKIADCLSSGGILIEGWNEINNENFLKTCNLNFNLEEVYGWEDDQYFVKIEYKFNNEWSNFVEIGNINLEGFCNQKGKNIPICVERSFYTLDKEKNQYEIKILGVVRKTEKNVM